MQPLPSIEQAPNPWACNDDMFTTALNEQEQHT